jgi:DNA mismatch repair protein MutL
VGTIRVLDPNVANQIAAGEVVERPASVVKELLENALDAGASRVDVAVEGGGADRIVVGDDGSGMERDDALLAFERHATSKIRRAADLQAIGSYGFRGEALPSIASVSRLVLTTSTGGTRGIRVRLRAGRILAVEPAPHPRGTTVEVEGLFANAPARRKFLRAAATETSHLAAVLTRVAAARPGITFSLKSGGRDLLSWPAVPDYRARVAQIVGRDDAPRLIAVDGRAGAMRVQGLASGPSLSRSTSTDQNLFVNGRPIRDRRLLHAIQAAYATLLPKGRYPLLYLFLTVPADEVDVNVHPAKAEVRFLKAGAVHDLVREALLEALGVSRPFYSLGPRHAAAVAEPDSAPLPSGASLPHAPELRAGERPVESPAGAPAPLFDAVALSPLAQFRDTYILASAPDGLVIVDQHAAHERVLYERFLAEHRSGRVAVQKLLFPVTVEVAPAEHLGFAEARAALEGLGFGIAPFGDRTLIVDEIPAFVPAGSVPRLVRELLREILDWREADGIDRLRHRIVATSACHAAVTANHPLDAPRMRAIMNDLMGTDMPMTCPHGRPVLLRFSLDRLEREFHRK